MPASLSAAARARVVSAIAHLARGIEVADAFDLLLAANAAAAEAAQYLVTVTSKADLPEPDGVRIPLVHGTSYIIATTVDLEGCYLDAGDGIVAVVGISSETSGLISTGLDPSIALIQGSNTLPMRDLFITHGTGVALDATASGNPDAALDWSAVNFVNCPIVGTIVGYANFIQVESAFLNSGLFTFGNLSGTVGFSGTLFTPPPNVNMLLIDPAATIGRRFRIIYSPMVLIGTSVGITARPSNFPINETFILDTVSFSGPGTPLAGISAVDNAALISNCGGVLNTANIIQYTMSNNAVPSAITIMGTFVKVAGATAVGALIRKFTHTNNRGTYVGSRIGYFQASVVLTITGAANKQYAVRVAKNGVVDPSSESKFTAPAGGRVENVTVQYIGELTETNYLEVWIAGVDTTTDPTVVDMNFGARFLAS